MTAAAFDPNQPNTASTHSISRDEANKLLADLLTGLKVPTAANFSPISDAANRASASMATIGDIKPTITMAATTEEAIQQNAAKLVNFVTARSEVTEAIKRLSAALKPIADYQKVLDGDAANISAGHTAVSAAVKKFSESIAAAKDAGLISDGQATLITSQLGAIDQLVELAKGEVTKVITTPERTIDYSSVPNLRFTSDWGIVEREKNKQTVIAKCKRNDILEAKLERTGVLDYIKTEFREATSPEIEALKAEARATDGKLNDALEILDKTPKSLGEYLTKDGLLTGLWRGVKTFGSLGIFGYRSVAKDRALIRGSVEGLIEESERAEIAVNEATQKFVTKGLSADLTGMKWIVDNSKEEPAVDLGEALLRQVSIPDGRTITHVEDLAEELKRRGFDVEGEAMTLKKDDHTLSFIRRTDGSVYMEIDGERQKGFLWTDKVEAVVSAFEADPKSVVMEKEPEQQTMVVQAVEKRATA